MPQSAEYRSGFQRALRLAQLIPASREPMYSPDFYAALRRYFDDGGYLSHPRFSEWWGAHDGPRIADALTGFCPWVASHLNLASASVLEIGCGTGSSTVALASHGARVVACDIHQPSLDVARIRAEEEGLEEFVTFHRTTADFNELRHQTGQFDLVVLYAVLEHMLPAERRIVFDVAWQVLKRGGAIAIYETPNRWAWRDRHTTNLIGWGWLRPEWALKYGIAHGKFPRDFPLERMYREGFGSSCGEIIGFLAGKRYSIEAPWVRPRLIRRVFEKAARTLLGLPYWAFAEYFSLIITKRDE